MAIKFSVGVRQAMLNAFEDTVGQSAYLGIRTLAPPASCAATDVGSTLAMIALPQNWMNDAGADASGEKWKAGTWQTLNADGSGVAAHFRLYATNQTTCHMQGTVSAAGGGGDMTVDNTTFQAGQQFTILTWKLIAPGA